MDRNEAEQMLSQIMEKRSGVDFLKEQPLQDEKLLGYKIGMPARELLLAYLDIENAFQIEIPEAAVAAGDFDTFSHILQIVTERIPR